MGKAGFVYTPEAEGDDTATCFYCNLALSGWDAEDDPAYVVTASDQSSVLMIPLTVVSI